MNKVSIIDYGLSNLLSVRRAFDYHGVETELIESSKKIDDATVLVLPGVGAFEDGMERLRKLGLIESLNKAVESGVPMLGICLGMQMLFDESEEFGNHKGLGYIPGRVVRIPERDIDGHPQKVPHVSWNPLYSANGNKGFSGTILEYVKEGEECYFIHSYEAIPSNPIDRLADTIYGGRKICAVVNNGNIYGTQFHPEKSGLVGLSIIKRFIELYC